MPSLQPGDALGASYRLRMRIGSGAAGDVWTAEPASGAGVVAAKILKSEHANDPALVERFVRERSVLLGLQHPNIVEVRDLVVEGTTLAIVMEFVPAGSVRDLLEEKRTLPPAEALLLCAEVLHALAAAHAAQITHRDIKPDNVLLAAPWNPGQRGTVRVSDFGIASVVSERQRHTTGLLGTPHYMAPELISHGRTEPAADVYSLGIMLYELIAGIPPFAGGGTDFAIAYRHISSRPPRLEVPDQLWAMLSRLLAKDPRQRPGAAEAAAELTRLADQLDGIAALEPAVEPQEFTDIERPATMLRSELLASGLTHDIGEEVSPLSAEAPDLGTPGQETLLRPMPKRDLPAIPAPIPTPGTGARWPTWLSRRMVWLAAAGLLLLAGMGVGIAVAFGDGPAEAKEVSSDVLQVTQQDPPLPTGLTVSRRAEFDPQDRQISLSLSYSAQKAPLSGEFFESVPAVDPEADCPSVVWTDAPGASGARHRASATGLEAPCGWTLSGVAIPENEQVTLTGTVSAEISDAAELEGWLARVATATSEVLADSEAQSTAYPAQRLRDIEIALPPRVVSQTPIPVSLLPVWPSGRDELNPLFRSPSTGKPSAMLQQVAGAENAVRLSDGCSGAVAVSADGLTVTALSVAEDCRIRASVGNFTSIESGPLSITTRE